MTDDVSEYLLYRKDPNLEFLKQLNQWEPPVSDDLVARAVQKLRNWDEYEDGEDLLDKDPAYLCVIALIEAADHACKVLPTHLGSPRNLLLAANGNLCRAIVNEQPNEENK